MRGIWDFLTSTLTSIVNSYLIFLLVFSLLGIATGIAALINGPKQVLEGMASITQATELHGRRNGETVIIDAKIEYTDIYANYHPTNRTMRSSRGNQYLYIIRFEDAPVAFTSSRNDIHLHEDIVIGRVGRMPLDFVAERLLSRYSPNISEFSQYTLRFQSLGIAATFEEAHERTISQIYWSTIFTVVLTFLLIVVYLVSNRKPRATKLFYSRKRYF